MSTKQFVWGADQLRKYQACEARNASGTITSQYFTHGQTIGGTSYFYTADHVANPTNLASQMQQSIVLNGAFYSPTFTSSIREMTNGSGAVQSQLSYDPYGRATLLQGSLQPDFQFGNYYFHGASGLSLTTRRPYSSGYGRFISRDCIGETGGVNLYEYVSNHPVEGTDPNGTCAAAAVGFLAPWVGAAAGAAATAIGSAIAIGAGQMVGSALGSMINNMSKPRCDAGESSFEGEMSFHPNPCEPPPSISTFSQCTEWCGQYCAPDKFANSSKCLAKCNRRFGASGTSGGGLSPTR